MSAANESDAAPRSGEEAVEPLFRVVRGTPTDVELAALSVVLAARVRPEDAAAASGPPPGPTAWAASSRITRAPGRPGPDAWRTSARG